MCIYIYICINKYAPPGPGVPHLPGTSPLRSRYRAPGAPGDPPERPRTAQDTPKKPPERKQTAQDATKQPKTAFGRLSRLPGSLQGAPGELREASRDGPKGLKSLISICFFDAFCLLTISCFQRSKTAEEAPKTAPRPPKRPPRRPQDGPRRPEDCPRGAQDGPRPPRNRPKMGPRAGAGGPQRPPRGLQNPPEAPNKPQTPERPIKRPDEAPKTAPERLQNLPKSPLQASWAPPIPAHYMVGGPT